MAEEQPNNLPEHVPLGRRFPPTIPQQQQQQPSLPTPTSTEYMSPSSPGRTGPQQQQQQPSHPLQHSTAQHLQQQQPGNNSNNKNARPAKRQKVSLACQECRDRKIKCDGVRPVCGPCVKKKRPEGSCVYEPERGRRGVKSQYVQLLENKVRELENAMRYDQVNASGNHGRSPSVTSIDRPPDIAPRNPTLSINHLTSPGSISFQGSPPPGPASQASSIRTNLIAPDSPASDSMVQSDLPLGNQDLGSGVRAHAPESNVRERWSNASYPGGPSPLQSQHTQQQPQQQQQPSNPQPHRLAPLLPQPVPTDQQQPQQQQQPQSQALPLPPLASTAERSAGPEVDAMGASTGIPDGREHHHGENDNRQGYFGSSSAMSFMREVREVIGKKTTLSPDDRSGGSPSRRFSQSSRSSRNTSARSVDSHAIAAANNNNNNNSSSSNNQNGGSQLRSYSVCHDYVLPPRKVADSLVRSYWTFVHTLYPFLHKPTFMKTYSRLWEYPEDDRDDKDHESEADPLFHCTLNLVFALGCQLSPEIGENEREPTSDIFFQRSKKLLHFDILDEGNIKVVQALLLMGQYLQCTKMPGRCWIVVGLATRVAQGLGLHRDAHNVNSGRHKANGGGCTRQLERELRKRLWGGCLVLDRVISMAYGRPFMIPVTQNLILPQAIDDELLTSYPDPPATQPENKPSHMAFFVHTLQLYEIMGDILTTLYSTGTRRLDNESIAVSDEQQRASNLSSIIRLEMALDTWEKALPWFLRLGTYTRDSANSPRNQRNMTDNILLRQNNVLRARYLHTCILLYRPVFAHFFALEESSHSVAQDTGLQRSLFLQSSTTCVTSAQELVEMIHRNIKELLPAWWYNMFYLYTSATVLLMARLFPKIKQAIGEDYLIESWGKCLNCLSRYQSYSDSAKWCYESLSELDKLAFQSNDEQPNNGMSSIQILGTLPGYTSNMGAAASEEGDNENMGAGAGNGGGTTSVLNPNFSASFAENNNNPGADWELDLQDMSWLGRLPVYTDLEPGLQFNQWLGRIDTDVNNL